MLNSPLAMPVPARFPDPVTAATEVAALAFSMAEARDTDGQVPDAELAELAATGLLHAPLPPALGGIALGMTAVSAPEMRDVLRIIGGGSLSLARLYEGHVNAVRLVTCYGNPAHLRRLASEAAAGRLSAVWNAQAGDGLRTNGERLTGGKLHTSGAGIVRRPIVTVLRDEGMVMAMPDAGLARADLSGWTPLGMKASLTGSVDFTGVAMSPDDVIGRPGDYYRAPLFAGGAWRVLAVQLGGLEKLVALYRDQLAARGRSDDPIQRARFGEATARLETARLWSARTATVAEDSDQDPAETDALVNLARHEFAAAALAVIERVEIGIGLPAMLRPNPVERIIRDLRTYLRQPFPDAALAAAAGWALAARPVHCDIGGS